MLLNRVQPPTAAGKLTTCVKPRPLLRSVILGCLVSLVPLGIAATPASATLTHEYLSQLTGVGNPTAVAFDGSAGSTKGDVYVADATARTVDRFTPAGASAVFSASGGYIEGSKLTGTPTGAGGAVVPFWNPQGVAVDDATGDVYVADNGQNPHGPNGPDVVDVFSSSGEYLSRITEVPASSHAEVSGPFESLGGLAFDQSTKELYVADQHVVDVFSSAGVYVSQMGNNVLKPNGVPNTVAVNEFTGDAYVGNAHSGSPADVYIFEPLGGVTEWTGASTQTGSFGFDHPAVGIDPSNDHVYVTDTDADVVDELGSSISEEYIDRLTGTPAGAFGGVSSVAVDPESHDVYVGDDRGEEGGVVDVFGPDVVIPTVEKKEASDVTASSAVLNGTVNPEEAGAATCEFEYGTSTEYGEVVGCEGPGSKTSPVPGGAGDDSPVSVASEVVTGLAPDTTYYYRLDATNPAKLTNKGQGAADEGRFTTAGPGFVGLASASSVTATSVSLNAVVDPNGAATSSFFQYGRTAAYGAQAPAGLGSPLGAGFEPVGVPSVHLGGLSRRLNITIGLWRSAKWKSRRVLSKCMISWVLMRCSRRRGRLRPRCPTVVPMRWCLRR